MEAYKTKNGETRYRGRITLPTGTRYSQVFSSQKAAKQWEARYSLEMERGQTLGHLLKHTTRFHEVVQEWFSRRIKGIKPLKTQETYASEINCHLLPNLSKRQIGQVSRADAENIRQEMLTKKLAPRTVNKAMIRLKQIMNYAVEESFIAVNPIARLKELPEPCKKDNYLSDMEVRQLLRMNAHEWIFPLLVVALNTGMRLGELAGLCWDRINLERRFIEVSRTLTREGLRDTTKTHLKRFVPINDETLVMLETLMRTQKSPRFIFVDGEENPVSIDHFTQRHFKRALRRAGLPLSCRFHDLRHTYASHFMMNGGNIYELQKILGHTKVEMTVRYAHLSDHHLQKAAQLVRFSIVAKDESEKTYDNFVVKVMEK